MRRVDGIGSGEYASSVLNSFNISMAASTRVSILKHENRVLIARRIQRATEGQMWNVPDFGEKFAVNMQETEQESFVNLQEYKIPNVTATPYSSLGCDENVGKFTSTAERADSSSKSLSSLHSFEVEVVRCIRLPSSGRIHVSLRSMLPFITLSFSFAFSCFFFSFNSRRSFSTCSYYARTRNDMNIIFVSKNGSEIIIWHLPSYDFHRKARVNCLEPWRTDWTPWDYACNSKQHQISSSETYENEKWSLSEARHRVMLDAQLTP